jgi:hypothetical protein
MEVFCTIQADKRLLLDAISEFVQIYRFDEVRVSLVAGQAPVSFDVPSTDWLEAYVALLHSPQGSELEKTLRGSGYRFSGKRTGEGVALRVHDRHSRAVVDLNLTWEEAKSLHECVFNCILEPFLDQGGQRQNLRDLPLFAFPCP